jgi:hypothetical protein
MSMNRTLRPLWYPWLHSLPTYQEYSLCEKKPAPIILPKYYRPEVTIAYFYQSDALNL